MTGKNKTSDKSVEAEPTDAGGGVPEGDGVRVPYRPLPTAPSDDKRIHQRRPLPPVPEKQKD